MTMRTRNALSFVTGWTTFCQVMFHLTPFCRIAFHQSQTNLTQSTPIDPVDETPFDETSFDEMSSHFLSQNGPWVFTFHLFLLYCSWRKSQYLSKLCIVYSLTMPIQQGTNRQEGLQRLAKYTGESQVVIKYWLRAILGRWWYDDVDIVPTGSYG